jgi:DNA end-binding protein Ku
MAPRATWTGSISFGMVNIPVGLCNAVTEQSISFKQFTAEGHAVGRQEIDKVTGEVVTRDQILRGIPSGDSFITVTDAEVAALRPAKHSAIVIDKFVDADDVDPIFFSKHLYAMVPAKGSPKAYDLLVSAITDSGKIAIGSYVVRDRQHVVAVWVSGSALVVSQLHYNAEVRKSSEAHSSTAHLTEAERQMALQLVEAFSGTFIPENYRDEQYEAVQSLISDKLEGIITEVTSEPIVVAPEVSDMMAQLEASLAAMRPAVIAG